MPLPVLAAFLRLGRKYEIDHVRQQAVKRLAAAFPSDFNSFFLDLPRGIKSIIILTKKHHNLLHLANIIRENEVLVYLPMALLRAIAQDHSGKFSIFSPSPDTQIPILPYTDIELCHKASIRLAQLQHTEIFSWVKPWEPAPTCGIRTCEEWRQVLDRQIFSPQLFIGIGWRDEYDGVFCEACRLYARGKYREGQRKVHEMLPSLFDLPPWEELREKWSKVYILLPAQKPFGTDSNFQ